MEHVDPHTLFPLPGFTRLCFLKNIVTSPRIIVGDYAIHDDPDDVRNFEKNVLYLSPLLKDRLIIGKFAQIAAGVRFLMNGGHHPLEGFSTFPFKHFGKSWGSLTMKLQYKGDTVIGNDAWIGNSSTIMPGIQIGDGAIVATNSLVSRDVEPYTVVGGNPARVIRKRFDDDTIAFLLELKWWDWPMDFLVQHLEAIATGDLEHLKRIKEEGKPPVLLNKTHVDEGRNAAM
ncbi:MAG: CatB-related O-acetyltransferase [Tatlockia sp.]|jgi:virginiamycin A acetyltransferase